MIRTVASLLLIAGLTFGADVADMSGTWVLNPKRSTWGKKEPPLRAEVTIRHKDPKYAYDGTITRNSESEGDRFSFEGAIDGKDYPIKEDKTKRTTAVSRKGKYVIESTTKGPDGKVQETATQTISRDGKTLVRKMHLVGADGQKADWTEIYEKKS